MRTLFKGGNVVSGKGVRRADLLVDGEKVVSLGRGLKVETDRTIDVTGCVLFPGFIDAHTHFDLEVAGTVTADGFSSGSRRLSGEAPPPSSTLPAPTRENPWPPALPAGGRRPWERPFATTAST